MKEECINGTTKSMKGRVCSEWDIVAMNETDPELKIPIVAHRGKCRSAHMLQMLLEIIQKTGMVRAETEKLSGTVFHALPPILQNKVMIEWGKNIPHSLLEQKGGDGQ
jgi:hypothetical protein